MYERLAEPEKALDDYNTAISLDPKLASAYCNRASYYQSVGRHDDSIADCTRAIEEEPQIMSQHAKLQLVSATRWGLDSWT